MTVPLQLCTRSSSASARFFRSAWRDRSTRTAASGVAVAIGAQAEEDVKIRLGVHSGLAAVAAEVGGHRRSQNEMAISKCNTGIGSRKGNHSHAAPPARMNAGGAGSGKCAHLIKPSCRADSGYVCAVDHRREIDPTLRERLSSLALPGPRDLGRA